MGMNDMDPPVQNTQATHQAITTHHSDLVHPGNPSNMSSRSCTTPWVGHATEFAIGAIFPTTCATAAPMFAMTPTFSFAFDVTWVD